MKNALAQLLYTDPKSKRRVRFPVKSGAVITIGRGTEAQVRISHVSVSRRHAEIRQTEGSFTISDLGSSNGTKVNDSPVKTPAPLSDGDAITCGAVQIRFVASPKAISDVPVARAKGDQSPAGETQTAQKRAKAANSDAAADPRDAGGGRAKSGGTAMHPAGRQSVPLRPGANQDLPPSRRPGARLAAVKSALAEESGETEGLRNQVNEMAKALRATEHQRDELQRGLAKKGGQEARALHEQLTAANERQRHLEKQLADERAVNGEQAARMRELQEQSTRYSMQLESVTEKYRQVREELDRLRTRLEEAREETIEKSDALDDLQRAQQIGGEELTALKTMVAEKESRIREMKIQLTEKGRLIDQLHDQLAETEYELNESRSEIKQLQAEWNRGGGELHQAQQRANVLREIIEDKENMITGLRRELEEKDREIKQARMGVGMTNLEEERRKVLDDFYKKSREVDSLTDELSDLKRDREADLQRVGELQKKLESADDDLLKRDDRARELEQQLKVTRRELASASRERGRLEERLEEITSTAESEASEAIQRAQNELVGLRVEVEQLKEKLTAARAELQQRASSPTSAGPALVEKIDGMIDSYAGLRANIALLTSYVGDVRMAVMPFAPPADPDGAETSGEASELDLALTSFEALVEVAVDDAENVQRDLIALRGACETP